MNKGNAIINENRIIYKYSGSDDIILSEPLFFEYLYNQVTKATAD